MIPRTYRYNLLLDALVFGGGPDSFDDNVILCRTGAIDNHIDLPLMTTNQNRRILNLGHEFSVIHTRESFTVFRKVISHCHTKVKDA